MPLIALAVVGMLFLQGAYLGPQPAVFVGALSHRRALQRRVARLTLASVCGGAIAPIVATYLFALTGTSSLITVYMVAVSIVSWLCALALPETYPRQPVAKTVRILGAARTAAAAAEVEEHRDERWGRDVTRCVQTPIQAEHFVERNGFAACMTDSRRPGPSLYVAVCGRRDAVMPRNVQTDEEASLTWLLKDEVIRRGRVYYAKLARGKAMFIAPRMIPYFNAVWGLRRAEEPRRLSKSAQAILRVLRREWEMGTSDLRDESGVTDRVAFTRAMDELQAAMIVVPSEVLYKPKFTYIWTLGVGRFPDALRGGWRGPPRSRRSRAAFSPAPA